MLDDKSSVAEVVIRRRKYHASVIKGQNSINRFHRTLTLRLIKHRPKRERPALIRDFPYVLSLFWVCDYGEINFQSPGVQRSLCALVEPSLVVASKEHDYVDDVDDVERVARKIDSISSESTSRYLVDKDIHSNSKCYSSWAGVVVVCDNISKKRVLSNLIDLETRIQTAWLISHYTEKWCNYLRENEQNVRGIENARWRILPLLKQAKSVHDTSITSRDSAILESLRETSNLDSKVQDADQAFREVREYIEYKSRARSIVYETYVEAALFVLAVCQAVPIFFDIPLVSISQWWLPVFVLPFLLLILFRLYKEAF